LTVYNQRWTGTPDEELWPRVQAEKRILFTADKGLASASQYPPGTHAGAVLFRLPRESRRGYLALLEFLIEQLDIATARGAIIVVSPGAIRIYRGPR
jgi:hypothetical protein